MKLKRHGGSLNHPKGNTGGWWKGRQNKHVTCRPLRSHKDSILGLHSCLALSQNPHNLDLNLDTEMLLHASIWVSIRPRKGGQIGMAVGILSDEYDIKSI